MEIQRYSLKGKQAEMLSLAEKETKNLIHWYFYDKKIYLYSSSENKFIDDFIETDDALFVRRKNPLIVLASSQDNAEMIGNIREGKSLHYPPSHPDLPSLKTLINMFLSDKFVYCYLSCNSKKLKPDILTFSPSEPSEKLYKKGKIMRVVEFS